jgi:hypothetical protein
MNHSNAFNSIVVELGSETENINPFLEPKEAGYRGIYRNHNASSNERMSFENMGIPPHLPGFHVEVDLKNRKVTVYDPLTRPKHAELRKAFEHYLSNPPRGVARRSYQPLADEVICDCESVSLFRWLRALWILIDAGHAQLREGKIPAAVIERVKKDRKQDAEAKWGSQEPAPELI